MRASTIHALTHMTDSVGWRQALLLHALASGNVTLLPNLLENIPYFVASHPTKCTIVLQTLLDLATKMKTSDNQVSIFLCTFFFF